MHNLELLIEEKEKYKNSEGKDILTKSKIIKTIESLIPQIDDDMKILEKELFFQKKKKSPDAKNKEEIMKLLKNKFILLKNKISSENEEEVNYDEKPQNLDDFLYKIEKNKNQSQYQERELYEEEDEKIKEWENKKRIEDGMINEISDLVKGMNSDAKNLEMTIGEMMKKTDKTKNKLNDNYGNIKKQTDRVNKLNKKIK